MATKTFDAVVIGGGPGGYVAAIRLAQLGKKAALVERDSLGGVCLNWGCIPSKALIAAANLVEDMRGASGRGILAEPPRIDVAKLRQFKDDVVKKLVGGVGQLEKGNGVEILRGTATLVGPGALEVDSGGEKTRVEAQAILVATGARPIEIPGFEYGKDVWSAKEAVDVPEIPGRLVVIGGGVIGLELGTVYAKLGSKVTVVEALPQILTGVDPEAVRLVQKGLRQRGVEVHVNAKAKGIERRPDGLGVAIAVDGKDQVLPADKVLVAVGFRPNSDRLGLEVAGVKLDPKGYVQVNERLQTNVPSIYAFGDLTGPPFLAHKASKEAEIAAEVVAGKKSERDWAAMPAAIFTDPEVASAMRSDASGPTMVTPRRSFDSRSATTFTNPSEWAMARARPSAPKANLPTMGSWPAFRASSSERPVVATSGSVKMAAGSATQSRAALRPAITSAAISPSLEAL